MAQEAPLIMVVDDDPDFRAMTREVLLSAGYRAACVADHAAALDLMRDLKPQLVITDLMMSALDSGFSLARAIKEDPQLRDTPVIVVTGVAAKLGYDFTPRHLQELAAMRADAFFRKPVLPGDLLAKIAELLGTGARGKP